MDELQLITLLNHIFERLSNIEDQNRDIQNDIKFIKFNAYKSDLMTIINLFEINNDDILYLKIFYFASNDKLDYFYALGQIYNSSLPIKIRNSINISMAYVFNKLNEKIWIEIDKYFVDGYNSKNNYKNINSCTDFWDLTDFKEINSLQFPNDQHIQQIKKHFNLHDNIPKFYWGGL